MDCHSKEIRSYNMSQIRNKNTKPEELVRKTLFAAGFRYRKNDRKLPGKPDIVLKKYRTVIFVNGCFWHMHNCRKFVLPSTNTIFWFEKLNKNKMRDKKNYKELKKLGWTYIVIWECQLFKNREKSLKKLFSAIQSTPKASVSVPY